MNRRDLLKLMLSSALAATVDVEKLLWVPKPIIVVPAMPLKMYETYFFMAGMRGGKEMLRAKMLLRNIEELTGRGGDHTKIGDQILEGWHTGKIQSLEVVRREEKKNG